MDSALFSSSTSTNRLYPALLSEFTINQLLFSDGKLSTFIINTLISPVTVIDVLGSNLQGKSQAELLDFRGVKTQIKAEFKLYREAAFDNLIGFYRVNDENGGIDTNNDGIIDLRPGDTLYAQAAVKARVSGMDLTVQNQTTASFSVFFAINT